MPPSTIAMSLRRIGALVLRQYFLLRSSYAKIIELFFWPMMNFIVWGYLSKYLAQQGGGSLLIGFGVLLAGGFLWEMLLRSQFSAVFGTLEELWSRNLAQLFIAPLHPAEYLAGMIAVSFLRTSVIILPCALIIYFMFNFSLFSLGWPVLAFYALQLMTGWWTAILLSGLLFRYGLTVEWMAWTLGFLLLPLTGAYYPVTVLPEWLQSLSWLLPPTYVFEGMREILQHGHFSPELLFKSFGLNLLYLGLSCWYFIRSFNAARTHGSLLSNGE